MIAIFASQQALEDFKTVRTNQGFYRMEGDTAIAELPSGIGIGIPLPDISGRVLMSASFLEEDACVMFDAGADIEGEIPANWQCPETRFKR